ncbi:MAG: hypothetical protein FWD88_05590 [Treponema sp.]|nr:hypothetical protein [Treponema sp.]
MVHFDKVSAGIVRYIVDEMIPHVVGGNPFIAGMAGRIIGDRGPAMLKPMLLENPMLKAAGIVDEKGGVDIDLLYKAAKESIEEHRECALDLPFGKVRLKADDIEKLNRLCRGEGDAK